MRVTARHDDPHDFETYMRGYMAKRRSDSDAPPTRSDDGTLSYTLRLGNLPAWLTTLLRCDLTYRETVQIVSNVAVVQAYCPDADVRVTMQIFGTEEGGTRVDCNVELTPTFKGIPIPQAPLRRFVESRFRAERARDSEFTAAVVARGDRGAADGGGTSPPDPARRGPGARATTVGS